MTKKRAALAALAAIAVSGPANAAVTISTASTQNMTCGGGVCAPTSTIATLNVADLEVLLASGATKVTTTGSGVQAGDIIVDASLTWTSANALTLDAYRFITMKQPVSADGEAALFLNTNDGGSHGSLVFAKRGHVVFANLSSSLTINGVGYMLVADLKSLASAIATNPGGNFALSRNYDASADGTYGGSPVATPLSGNFEGLGNQIRNLVINDPNFAYIGLFAELDGGTIKDIGVVNANITATNNNDGLYFAVGALIGYDNGSVSGSYSTGSANGVVGTIGGLAGIVSQTGRLSGSHSTVSINFAAGGNAALGAGLIGWNFGTVVNSYATGSISYAGTSGAFGGFVAYNGGAISSSFASGSPSARHGSSCGGFVGSHYQGKIENSYSTGSAACGATYSGTGGFAGGNVAAINQSYSTGNVDGRYYNGGFAGYQDGSLKKDYWDTTTSGTNSGVGEGSPSGVKGLTTQQLQSGLPRGLSPAIWTENSRINNGFPYLIANPPPK